MIASGIIPKEDELSVDKGRKVSCKIAEEEATKRKRPTEIAEEEANCGQRKEGVM